MMGKAVVLSLSILVTLSHGAVLPMNQDALFNVIQSFLTEPERFSEAFGMSRVKRSSNDEINFDALGVKVHISYIDPKNRMKGGKADIAIDNLRRFVPQSPVSYTHLKINFDSGDNSRDGLFHFDVDYEIHCDMSIESGSFTVERKKDGNMWKSLVSIQPTSSNYIPPTSFTLESDHSLMIRGALDFLSKYSFEISRTLDNKLHMVAKGAGRIITIDATLNIPEKMVVITVDVDGQQYKFNVDFDLDGDSYDIKASTDDILGRDLDIKCSAKKDYSDTSCQFLYNGKNAGGFKIKGKIIPNKEIKYEGRYNIGNQEGKLRFSVVGLGKNNIEIKIQSLPFDGTEHKILITNKASANGGDFHFLWTIKGNTYLEYKDTVVWKESLHIFELTEDIYMEVNRYSPLFGLFCMIECIEKNMTTHTYFKMSKTDPLVFHLDYEQKKSPYYGSPTMDTAIKLNIDTMKNPLIFKLYEPKHLPKLLPSGKDSIDVEVDLSGKAMKHLKVKTNTDIMKTFSIEQLDEEMAIVKINGKELAHVSTSMDSNNFKQSVILPGGATATYDVTWNTQRFDKNKVTLIIEAPGRNLQGELDWDMRDENDQKYLKLDAKGENPKWGKFEIKRDLKIFREKYYELMSKMTGTSTFANAPWPSPVKTDVETYYDTRPGYGFYYIQINKDFDGTKIGVTLQDGNLYIGSPAGHYPY